MIVKLLTEYHLEFRSLKGGCTGSSESTNVKMPHCWKSHALAHILISCAGSYCDLCTLYVSSECCGESAPATMAHLYNHRCVVPMLQKMLPVHCNKIPRKKTLLVYQETNREW